MTFSSLAIVFFLFQFVHLAFSCNGYGARLVGLRHCKYNYISLEPNPTIELTKECNLVLNGCINISHKFESADLSCTIKTEFLSSPVKEDICKNFSDPKTPGQCPAPGRHCLQNATVFNLHKFSNILNKLEGRHPFKHCRITYNTGRIDTFKFGIEIFKKKDK